MEVTGILEAKTKPDSQRPAFKMGVDWFEVQDAKVKPYFDKVQKGQTVTVTYEIAKGRKLVSMLVVKTDSKAPQASTSAPTGAAPKKWNNYQKKSYGTGGNDDDRQTAIARGNSLNAAAALMSNPNVMVENPSPENMAAATLQVAEILLEWLKKR